MLEYRSKHTIPGESGDNFDNLFWIEFCLRDDDLLALKVDEFIAEKDTTYTLGERYKVVLRSRTRWLEQNKPGLRDTWPKKWNACQKILENKSFPLRSKLLTTSELEQKLMDETLQNSHVLGLTFEPSRKNHLPGLLDSGVPIVLWVRSGADRAEAEKWLRTQFPDKDNPDLRHLGDLVRKVRGGKESPLRKSLVLLWDNFDHQLDSLDIPLGLDSIEDW